MWNGQPEAGSEFVYTDRESSSDPDATIYDKIGIGFGPANLALAVAMQEAPPEQHPPEQQLDRLFLEAKSAYVWHPGVFLEGTLLQVKASKDLIAVKSPRSPFTFLNYLQEKARLYKFLHPRSLFPTRLELKEGLGWVAAQLDRLVVYGREVFESLPIRSAEELEQSRDERFEDINVLKVITRDPAPGKPSGYLPRRRVRAIGAVSKPPPGMEPRRVRWMIHFHHFFSDVML